ncbi:MAG: molybdate ABC transporter substrate-binding protein [Rhodospirillales bacterium]
MAATTLALSAGGAGQARAAEALVAVAANFAEAVETLKPEFERATGHTLVVTTGSTGKLYAQIAAGAPFHVLLSADAEAPARLEREGLAVGSTRTTYAIGKLTLWSADSSRIGADGRAVLTDPGLRFVIVANPDLAPYGVAARQALRSMELWERLQPKIAMAQNIGQAHSMVASGAAEVGFVALSAVLSPRASGGGSRWDVPQDLFEPIRQDAVVLNPGKDNPAVAAFLDFLKTNEARAVIERYGYANE